MTGPLARAPISAFGILQDSRARDQPDVHKADTCAPGPPCRSVGVGYQLTFIMRELGDQPGAPHLRAVQGELAVEQ